MLSFLFALLSVSVSAQDALAVDWSQPPLACVEDVVPSQAPRPCLDLSGVANPSKDWPDLSADDRAFWNHYRHGLTYCRAEETLRRETLNPGSQSSSAVQTSWMRVKAINNHDVKVRFLYEAAKTYQMPVHVLTGAINQESLFAELGIADDGGNFSCGVAQINLSEWCGWANRQSAEKKREMNWPVATVNCTDNANKSLIEPFYKIALQRLGRQPSYRLEWQHFVDIPYDRVEGSFPRAPESTQRLRYQVATSFLENCMKPADAIMAKANELRRLYDNHIPAGLKNSEVYSSGDSFKLQCQDDVVNRAYPLQTGWLLAVGSYNAGPRSIDLMASRNKWNKSDLAKSSTFVKFNPQELIASVYFAGDYNKRIDRLEAPDLNGNTMQWVWFKQCVLQRHIARVVQHVTSPRSSQLATSLEGSWGCRQSAVDPDTGQIIPGFPGKR